jgi:hypothetical protein
VPNPKKKLPTTNADVRSLARGYTETIIRKLGGLVETGETDAVKVSACAQLLDRGWGKPNQPHEAHVEGELRITIRNILEGKK